MHPTLTELCDTVSALPFDRPEMAAVVEQQITDVVSRALAPVAATR